MISLVAVSTPSHADAAANISVWWPTEGVTMSGTQPLKALADGMPANGYSMYWQVDGGQLSPMSDSSTSYPHKEVTIDVSGWHWSSTGSYKLNFVAEDPSGNVIGQKSVAINANKTANALTPVPVQPTVPSQPVNPTPPTQNPPVPTQPNNPVQTIAHESIWWPTDGVTVQGIQPFKAVIDGFSLSQYAMYWQVDGGQLNRMNDVTVNPAHKEISVDLSVWNWKGAGPYVLTFVAQNPSGIEVARKSVSIYTGASASTPPTQIPTPVVPVQPAPAPTPTPVPSSGNPLSGLSFFVDTNNPAQNQANIWQGSRSADAQQMRKIADQPVAKWLGGWNANIYADVKNYVDAAANNGKVPVMIAYNIPNRDCNGYSSGGASSADAYNSWIQSVANGIGSRKAVVVLEPDGLSMVDCLSSSDASTRYALLGQAIRTLKANNNTSVYVDAGNSNWVSASTMAQRLKNINVASADGFALNVSNFYWTNDLISYGRSISSQIGNKHFIIDTSRNGLGPDNGQWCNPSGRALGVRPTSNTGNSLVDAFLWLKTPGESDGACNGGPNAGTWWPEYALGLAQKAAY